MRSDAGIDLPDTSPTTRPRRPPVAHVAVHLEEVVEVAAHDARRPAHAEERHARHARQLARKEARLDLARDVEIALHLRPARELLVEARGLEPERALVRDRQQVVEVLAGELLLGALAPDGEKPEELAVRRERQDDRDRPALRGRHERAGIGVEHPAVQLGEPHGSALLEDEPGQHRPHRKRGEARRRQSEPSVKAPSSPRGRRRSRLSSLRSSAVRDVRSARSFGLSSCDTTERLMSRSACWKSARSRKNTRSTTRCIRLRSGIEEKHDDEAEAERERGRREERRRRDGRDERVARHDAERVEPRDDGRQGRVDERLADDDLDVEEPEPHDRVRERERDDRHRHDAPREIPVLAEERREEDGEDDERHDAGHGAEQEDEDRPARRAVLARPPRVREREEAEDEVVREEDPVERGRAVDEPPRAAASRARHLEDVEDGRERVQERSGGAASD